MKSAHAATPVACGRGLWRVAGARATGAVRVNVALRAAQRCDSCSCEVRLHCSARRRDQQPVLKRLQRHQVPLVQSAGGGRAQGYSSTQLTRCVFAQQARLPTH